MRERRWKVKGLAQARREIPPRERLPRENFKESSRIPAIGGDMLLNMTANDLELLRQFTRDGSQDAFTTLVQRQVNLVYSAALRQVRSPQLAEEIAQSVFADLAREAGKWKPDTILTAWLYAVTRRTAIDVIRKESRRQLREQIAVELHDMNANPAEWRLIEPLLDDAMAALDETDRTAILLRYFENKSLREVGAALGTTDDAAQKRVSRAVERLREFFSKRNVTIGASGLVVFISANAVQAAPVGLAATVSAAAVLAGTAISTSTVIAATKTIAMTTLQKTLVTVTAAVLAGVGIYEARQAAQLRDQVQTLQQQQAPLAEQIQRLQQERNEATNRAAWLQDHDPKQLRREHLELLSLRGRVTQLANELRERKSARSLGDSNPDPQPNEQTADSILLTATLATNSVVSGNSLLVGGWSLLDRRGYLLITPVIVPDNPSSGGRQITIQGQIIQAPESFWDEIGWGTYKSATRRSTLAGELTPEQVRLLLQALKETKDAAISPTPPETIPDGERRGFGFSRQEDDGTGGALMGVDFYPRISADGHSVGIEIIPTPVSANVPIHPALKSK